MLASFDQCIGMAIAEKYPLRVGKEEEEEDVKRDGDVWKCMEVCACIDYYFL